MSGTQHTGTPVLVSRWFGEGVGGGGGAVRECMNFSAVCTVLTTRLKTNNSGNKRLKENKERSVIDFLSESRYYKMLRYS